MSEVLGFHSFYERKKRLKIEREKLVVEKMIQMYCKGNHRTDCLCDDCHALFKYAEKRLNQCPWKDDKPFCSHCTISCYEKEQQEQIKTVMRYAGPRMIYHHPILALQHMWEAKKDR